jgi:hypothetical protein
LEFQTRNGNTSNFNTDDKMKTYKLDTKKYEVSRITIRSSFVQKNYRLLGLQFFGRHEGLILSVREKETEYSDDI